MMKRTAAWILAAALLAAMLPACAENWYCPQCGRLNDGNFCPYDGTANPLRTSDEDPYEQDPFWYVYSEYAYMPAVLNSRLSTRTGPGTQYDEPGSFLKAGSEVTVLSKAYDTRNEIWWLQVSFREAGREKAGPQRNRRENGRGEESLEGRGEGNACRRKDESHQGRESLRP